MNAADPPEDNARESEDAQIHDDHMVEHRRPTASSGRSDVVGRWRELRAMLISQLEMFESGGLTLRADNIDVSAAAIGDLKRNIQEFDELILQEAAGGDGE